MDICIVMSCRAPRSETHRVKEPHRSRQPDQEIVFQSNSLGRGKGTEEPLCKGGARSRLFCSQERKGRSNVRLCHKVDPHGANACSAGQTERSRRPSQRVTGLMQGDRVQGDRDGL